MKYNFKIFVPVIINFAKPFLVMKVSQLNKCISILSFIFFCGGNMFAQDKKTIEAHYISHPLVIDGVLDDSVYQMVKPAKDFLQIQPYNGKPSIQPSEVYYFYDQTAIYVGAMLYDSAPDSIFNFFSERDNIGMSDFFGVYLDPYNQGQLAYGFFITPAGVQTDIKAVKSDFDSEDDTWNAVWESKTKITERGWVVEMRIPYSALRFSEKANSNWGLNMFRNIRRYNSNNSWNLVDRKVSGFIHQEGQLSGIKNIKPPVRLSLSPYSSSYFQVDGGKNTTDFLYKGGLDLKYGINESFTLDMMLIPDFGQIQSDDKQLNLSPYELFYSEKRQFFTEGTELFQRGNIFYSRRIGAAPKFADKPAQSLIEHEIVDYNPSETQLINASKISGRTANGWGLGFLNSNSLASYATLRDTITGAKRKILVQPFTNYNVSVVDKSLKNNSYISIINSNVSMLDNPFLANVTATEFQFRDKSLKFALKGKAGLSTRGDTARENGYFASLGIDKNRGNLQYGILQNVYSDKFNPNDLGYLHNNNQLLTEAYIYYQIIEPFWKIRECNGNFWWDYTRIFNPSTVFDNKFGFNARTLLKNNYRISVNGGYGTEKHDYFEPRVSGRYFVSPHLFWYNYNLTTDTRKHLWGYFHYGGYQLPGTDRHGYMGNAELYLRIGQRLQFSYMGSFNTDINDYGYVDKTNDDKSIYFAQRNVHTLENIFITSYAFNNKTTISIRARHYYSGAANKKYYQLQTDGNLQTDDTYNQNKDTNYNAFNVDMLFRWIFAPGSELSFAWKNSISTSGNEVLGGYWRNLDRTWRSDQINSLSLKVLYYIDYNRIQRKRA